ncbi:MAG: hypothetical protein RBU29_17285, partial [bacterium]|nr:hypothetical protein [bacterium]
LLGIVLVGFWWASDVWLCFVNWLKETPTSPSFMRLRLSTLVLAGVVVASLINPSGYHIHLLPSKVTQDAFLVQHIGELSQPPLQHLPAFELIILGLFVLPMLQAGRITTFEGFLIVFFGHQALNHVRHVPLFALITIPPLISALAEERTALLPPGDEHKSFKEFWGKLYAKIIWCLHHHLDLALVFLLVAYLFGWHGIWQRNVASLPDLFKDGYYTKGYPTKACDFIEYNKITGRMFNHDNFAGYLIWRFSPEFSKVWTDTRYDLWGSYYMKEELAVIHTLDIPLGFYDKNGTWMSFEDYKRIRSDLFSIKTREELDVAVKTDSFFRSEGMGEEFKDWYASGKPYWKYVLDKYQVEYILMFGGFPIDRALKKNYEGWVLIYENPDPNEWYTIHMRNTPENQQWIRKYGKTHQEHWVEPIARGSEAAAQP